MKTLQKETWINLVNYLLSIIIILGFMVAGQAVRNPDKSAMASIMQLAFIPIWVANNNNSNSCD